MRIAIVLGTRPEIIKFSPIIRECKRVGVDYFVLHTGQHYSYNMDKIFFQQLDLPGAKYRLDVGSGRHGKQTGKMLAGVETVLLKEMPDIVLVEGDTNTALAGALAAAKLSIHVGHVEAGLRSYARWMPEEINRVLADHCSDILFAPTDKSARILADEGISKNRVFMVGNTVVDAVRQNLEIARSKTNVFEVLGLKRNDFMVATVHRQENADYKERFSGILAGLQRVQKEFGIPLIFPVHPRSKKRIKEFDLDFDGLRLVDAMDYLSFLRLEGCARLVLTDSGGVQEEACILRVPCVTVRDNTERPETLEVGANMLAGADPDLIVECARAMVEKEANWIQPFGDGDSAKRILKILWHKFE